MPLKSLAYWEAKKEDTLARLTGDGAYLLEVPLAPQRQYGDPQWAKRYREWQAHQRYILAQQKRYEKAIARLHYIEERLRATRPNFWTLL